MNAQKAKATKNSIAYERATKLRSKAHDLFEELQRFYDSFLNFSLDEHAMMDDLGEQPGYRFQVYDLHTIVCDIQRYAAEALTRAYAVKESVDNDPNNQL